MPIDIKNHAESRRLTADGGFTMIIALGVMLVASLLMVAAFTAANGDIGNAHTNVTQKQAYYVALAGIQEYEYKLEANPNYWQTCPKPEGPVPGETSEKFAVTTLAASTDTESSKLCNASNPFVSIIESKGTLANTFRIKSVGTAGKSTRSLVANFQVAGFLNYIYFTQYEVADPTSYKGGDPRCANYRAQRQALGISCIGIVFGPEDTVNGPLHTDDTAEVCGGAEFGRPKHEDLIEMNGGAVPDNGCGSGSPIYNTPTGGPIVGPELVAPESDSSLKVYVEHTPQLNEFTGRTYLELNGETSKIKVTTIVSKKSTTKEIEWPKNGLIYVGNGAGGCAYTEYEQEATDTTATYEKEESCGSVYVKGTFSKSLTVAAETDVIVNGGITPYGITPPAAAPSTTTVGLIATRFVRLYHPCSSNTNGSGAAGSSLENPWIYAAILSTSHSFLVDNYNCGRTLGNLNVYGAIAQKFRGIVGEVNSHGYNKEYIYDERLATDEPPYFLAPLKAGWKIKRLTATTPG
jgi:hypothetical protein